MIIIDNRILKEELVQTNKFPNGFVKGVVDIGKGIVALDADMHYELADYLKKECSSE